jgi:hypothetical protein
MPQARRNVLVSFLRRSTVSAARFAGHTRNVTGSCHCTSPTVSPSSVSPSSVSPSSVSPSSVSPLERPQILVRDALAPSHFSSPLRSPTSEHPHGSAECVAPLEQELRALSFFHALWALGHRHTCRQPSPLVPAGARE